MAHEPRIEVISRDLASTDDAILSRQCYDVLGYRVAIGVTSEEAEAAVRVALRGFGPIAVVPGPSLPRYDLVATPANWQVRVDGAVIHTGDDFLSALRTLEARVVRAALDRRDDMFQLHGAALCLPIERAGLVLAGDSGCGKTTLTMGLMLRGFVPFSDDVALLEPATLELRAFRRAFHINDEVWPRLETLGQSAPAPRDGPVGYFSPPQWAERPVPVRWVLFPQYVPDQPPELTPLAPSEAATAILRHSTSLSRAARVALGTMARLIERSSCYRLAVGDLAGSVAVVHRLVTSHSREEPKRQT
jgi:hypothetical protein